MSLSLFIFFATALLAQVLYFVHNKRVFIHK